MPIQVIMPKLGESVVEGTVGHDSNVNAATSDRSVSVPAFGGFVFPLAPGAYSRSDKLSTEDFEKLRRPPGCPSPQ